MQRGTMMMHDGGWMVLWAILYVAIMLAVVAFALIALWRMARAQERIAQRLEGVEQALAGRGGMPPVV